MCTTFYSSVVVCYFWEPCLPLTFKPTGNGKNGLQVLKLMLRSDGLKTQLFLVVEGLTAELLQF